MQVTVALALSTHTLAYVTPKTNVIGKLAATKEDMAALAEAMPLDSLQPKDYIDR